MLVIPDYVYKFTFKSALSVLNGIYRVTGVFSYAELFTLNIDLYKTTYGPNGIAEPVFEADLDIIRLGEIAKLVHIDDPNNIQYIPFHMFAEVPDGSIQRYFQIGIVVDLGIYDNAEQLSTLKSEIEQTVEAMTGIDNNALIYTIKNTWMSIPEYQVIDTTRTNAISRVSNHYVDKKSLQKEVDSLRTKLIHYENALKSL